MITARDKQVLTWIGEQYAVRIDHLRLLMGRDAGKPTAEPGRVSRSNAERRVRVWIKDGLVERKKIFIGQPAWIWLTRQGLGLLENDYRFLEPKVATLDHIHAVNQVRLWLEKHQGRELLWQSERELKYVFGRDEKTKTKHVPDGLITTGAGTVALEVELTQKVATRLKRILLNLVRDYDTIWYFANDRAYGPIGAQIATLTEKNQQRFSLRHLRETGL
jgi:hypothetical protein